MSKSILKNAFSKIILNVFNIIIPIIIGPYVLRTLGPTINGEINYSQAIFGYFFIFAGFGVYQYGLREVSGIRDDETKLRKLFSSLFIITVVSNVATTVAYVIFINILQVENTMYSMLFIFSINLLSNIFYVEWINEALEEYSFITVKTIAIKIIYVILLLLMVKSADDFQEYMFLLILSTFLNNIISYIYIKKKIKFDFEELEIKRHIVPMFHVVILSNANVLYTQLDKIFLGKYVDADSVAFYSVSQNICNMVNAMLLSAIYVSIPRLSNYIANNNIVDYEKLLNKISKIYFFLLFPVAIGMISISKEIILIYGGLEYIEATNIFVVFVIYVISAGYEVILSNQIMYILGKEKIQVKIIFVCGFINLILKIFILNINMLNGTTAIITTLLANLIVIIMEYTFIKHKLRVKYDLFSFDKLKYCFISFIFIPIAMLLRSYIDNIILLTIAIITISGVSYIFILFAIKDQIFSEFYTLICEKMNPKNKKI